jgi:hypothetical protein
MFDSIYAIWGTTLAPWLGRLALAACAHVPSGLLLVAWGGRRRLYRRNFAGVEEFNSYGHMVGSRLVEDLAGRIGALMFGLGAVAGLLAGFGLYLQRY